MTHDDIGKLVKARAKELACDPRFEDVPLALLVPLTYHDLLQEAYGQIAELAARPPTELERENVALRETIANLNGLVGRMQVSLGSAITGRAMAEKMLADRQVLQRCSTPGCDKPALDQGRGPSVCRQHDPGR
jgi:hypothetical protein